MAKKKETRGRKAIENDDEKIVAVKMWVKKKFAQAAAEAILKLQPKYR